jgi:hypothetical protein
MILFSQHQRHCCVTFIRVMRVVTHWFGSECIPTFRLSTNKRSTNTAHFGCTMKALICLLLVAVLLCMLSGATTGFSLQGGDESQRRRRNGTAQQDRRLLAPPTTTADAAARRTSGGGRYTSPQQQRQFHLSAALDDHTEESVTQRNLLLVQQQSSSSSSSRRSFLVVTPSLLAAVGSGAAVVGAPARSALAVTLETNDDTIMALRTVRSSQKKLSSETVSAMVAESDYKSLQGVLRTPPVSNIRKACTTLAKDNDVLKGRYQTFITALEKLDATAQGALRGRTVVSSSISSDLSERYQATIRTLQDFETAVVSSGVVSTTTRPLSLQEQIQAQQAASSF